MQTILVSVFDATNTQYKTIHHFSLVRHFPFIGAFQLGFSFVFKTCCIIARKCENNGIRRNIFEFSCSTIPHTHTEGERVRSDDTHAFVVYVTRRWHYHFRFEIVGYSNKRMRENGNGDGRGLSTEDISKFATFGNEHFNFITKLKSVNLKALYPDVRLLCVCVSTCAYKLCIFG